jgi:hypothetical protein
MTSGLSSLRVPPTTEPFANGLLRRTKKDLIEPLRLPLCVAGKRWSAESAPAATAIFFRAPYSISKKMGYPERI